MRLPRRRNSGQSRTSTGTSAPAPVSGWNTHDSIASMDILFANILDNWFCEPDFLRLRGGSESHATGIGSGPVDTLISYESTTTDKLLACGNNNIYDVTGNGAVGASLKATTNNRWQYVNYRGVAFAVNGSDSPIHYDGATVTNPSLSGAGLTTSDLIHINVHKERVWCIEKSSTQAWYLPVQQTAGTLTKFDVGPFMRKGGYLMAMATWSVDGGSGLDDYAVFVTSEGEILVYQGTDPASATTWALVGVYTLFKPIGRRCFIEAGGDVLLTTRRGVFPLSRSLRSGRIKADIAVSDNISKAFNESAQISAHAFGWQPHFFSEKNMLIYNVPVTEGTQQQQYVMNTLTGAWSRFTDLNANCWGNNSDRLYFGGNDGTVYIAESGTSDVGANIVTDMQQAFSYFGKKSRQKMFKMVRPIFFSDSTLVYNIGVDVDFEDKPLSQVSGAVNAAAAEWDESFWDLDDWGGSDNIIRDWHTVSGIGYAAALRLTTATNSQTLKFLSSDWIMEDGGFV